MPTSSGIHGKVRSVAVNPRTLELLVGLIRKVSKWPTCPDIENEDLASISSTNPESRPLYSLTEGDKSSFSMSGHVPYRPTDTAV